MLLCATVVVELPLCDSVSCVTARGRVLYCYNLLHQAVVVAIIVTFCYVLLSFVTPAVILVAGFPSVTFRTTGHHMTAPCAIGLICNSKHKLPTQGQLKHQY